MHLANQRTRRWYHVRCTSTEKQGNLAKNGQGTVGGEHNAERADSQQRSHRTCIQCSKRPMGQPIPRKRNAASARFPHAGSEESEKPSRSNLQPATATRALPRTQDPPTNSCTGTSRTSNIELTHCNMNTTAASLHRTQLHWEMRAETTGAKVVCRGPGIRHLCYPRGRITIHPLDSLITPPWRIKGVHPCEVAAY